MSSDPVPTSWVAGARPERLALGAVIVIGLWMACATPVVAQEAYYWTYAKHLDWSYFDHPPMVGWLIAAGTACLGDGALGIRAGTLLCAVATTLLGCKLLASMHAERWARVAWIVLSLGVPMFAVGHVLANPDPPLVLFWMATVCVLWHVRHTGSIARWMLAGALAGGALLSKYSAAFLGIGGILVMLLDPTMRRQLGTPGPWLGLATAGVVFLPVVLWNREHDWASFQFQGEQRYEHSSLRPLYTLEMLLEQTAILSPLLACLAIPAVIWFARRAQSDARAVWLLAFALPLPVYMAVNSLWMEIKVNWLMPAYLTLVMAILLWWRESGTWRRHRRTYLAALGIAALVYAACLMLPLIDLIPQAKGSSWSGWTTIAARAEHWSEVLQQEHAREHDVFYFASDFHDASQLALHLLRNHKSGTQPEVTFAQNTFGQPAREFDFYASPRDRLGDCAVYVLPRPDERPDEPVKARSVFRTVSFAERVTIERLGIVQLEADIYLCRGYRGPVASKAN